MTTSEPSKSRRRPSPSTESHRKAQAPGCDPAQGRYENAWDENVGYLGKPAAAGPWSRLRALAGSRGGRVVMIAPVGALGAYLLLRRRR